MKAEIDFAVDSMSPLAVMELIARDERNSVHYRPQQIQQDEIAKQRQCLVEHIDDLCDCCDS